MAVGRVLLPTAQSWDVLMLPLPSSVSEPGPSDGGAMETGWL